MNHIKPFYYFYCTYNNKYNFLQLLLIKKQYNLYI